jgi:hypothetical protein
MYSNSSTSPRPMITAFEHNCSASLIECVVNIVDPYPQFFIVYTIATRELGSRPVEHSSNRRIVGSPNRPTAMQIFLLFPPDKSSNRLLKFIDSNYKLSNSHSISLPECSIGTKYENMLKISNGEQLYHKQSSW